MIVGRAKTVLRFDRWWKEEREGERERDCGRVPGRMDRLSVETGTDNERYRVRHVVFRTFLYLGARCDKYPVHGSESLSIYGKGIYAMVVGGGVFSRPIPLIFTSDLHVEAVYRKAANYRQFIGLNASIGLSRIHRAVPSMGKRDLRFLGSTPPSLLSASFFPFFLFRFIGERYSGEKGG